MRNARPLLLLLLVMIVLWSIAGWIWPTAVLYYFAIAGVTLAIAGVIQGFINLVHDIKRELESIGGRDGRRHRNT